MLKASRLWCRPRALASRAGALSLAARLFGAETAAMPGALPSAPGVDTGLTVPTAETVCIVRTPLGCLARGGSFRRKPKRSRLKAKSGMMEDLSATGAVPAGFGFRSLIIRHPPDKDSAIALSGR